MNHYPVTLTTAAALSVFYVFLGIAVSGERYRTGIGLGTGGQECVALGSEHKASRLLIAVRRHGHFAEYVPLSLILLLVLEISGESRTWLVVLASVLVGSRIMIVLGLGRSAPNLLRAGGNLLQLLMLMAAAMTALVLVWSSGKL